MTDHATLTKTFLLHGKNICSNYLENRNAVIVVIFLNVFLNLKSKHIIKGAIAQIERKQVKLNI